MTDHIFLVCVNNNGYRASLELNKRYRQVIDLDAERHGLVRIIDESGEAYLYARSRFMCAHRCGNVYENDRQPAPASSPNARILRNVFFIIVGYLSILWGVSITKFDDGVVLSSIVVLAGFGLGTAGFWGIWNLGRRD